MSGWSGCGWSGWSECGCSGGQDNQDGQSGQDVDAQDVDGQSMECQDVDGQEGQDVQIPSASRKMLPHLLHPPALDVHLQAPSGDIITVV